MFQLPCVNKCPFYSLFSTIFILLVSDLTVMCLTETTRVLDKLPPGKTYRAICHEFNVYINTHTHTHTHTYIVEIYIYKIRCIL